MASSACSASSPSAGRREHQQRHDISGIGFLLLLVYVDAGRKLLATLNQFGGRAGMEAALVGKG